MVLTKPKTYVSCASVQQSCPTALKTGLQCLHVRKRNTSQKRCINKLVGDEVAVSTLMQCPLFSTVIFTTKITQIHNLSALKRHVTASSSLLACNSRLRSTIRWHHPPQRVVLSQICCFGERKVVLFQILLDGAEPRDAGTT